MDNMKTIKIIAVLLVILLPPMFGQTYTLKQCLEYAQQNNSDIKIASLNAAIKSKKVDETIGTGLPQIDFSGTLEDNIKISTSMLPGELMGIPGTTIPVKMGTQYNATASFQLNQKIYDPSFWVGLKAAKLSEGLSKQNIKQTDEQAYYNICAAYYKAVIQKMQLDNLSVIYNASNEALKSTELRYKNGMAKKIDVDKIKVSNNNTKSQLEHANLNYRQALNNLKYSIGMPMESILNITETLNDNYENEIAVNDEARNDLLNLRTDYQIQKLNLALQQADRENNIASYIPSLSLYAKYNFQAMRQQFDVFNFDKEWYSNSVIGITLKVPIFSGLTRYSKVQESELNIKVVEQNLIQTEQQIKVEVSNYNIQFKTALDNIRNEKENLQLAESVYKNTKLEYNEGAGSSLDLVQAESSLRETQNNYYTRLLNLYIAKIDKEKAEGNFLTFINNLK